MTCGVTNVRGQHAVVEVVVVVVALQVRNHDVRDPFDLKVPTWKTKNKAGHGREKKKQEGVCCDDVIPSRAQGRVHGRQGQHTPIQLDIGNITTHDHLNAGTR